MRRATFVYLNDAFRSEGETSIGHVEWSEKDMAWSIEWYNNLSYEEGGWAYELVADSVFEWVRKRRLPLIREDLSPWQDRWWEGVSKLLCHSIRLRLDTPR